MPPRVSVRRAGLTRWPASAAVVITAIGTVGTHQRETPPGPVWIGVVLAVGAISPILVERPGPIGLMVSGALTGAYFAAGYADGPVFLAVPAVALVDRSGRWRRQWTASAIGAALGVAGLWARQAWHNPDRPATWQSIGLVAVVAAASSLATALRSRRDAAAEQARSTASEERLRMAVELHDGVGHGLAVISMQAGVALHMLDRDPSSLRAHLEAIRDVSHESLGLLRGQLSHLTGAESAPRTPAPDAASLRALTDRVRSGGLEVELSVPAEMEGVPDPVSRVIYAVVQEGLTNVLRHASATRADVTLRLSTDTAVISVVDDGRAGPSTDATPPGVPARNSLGIAGLRSRIEELGGRLDAAPRAGGFVLAATIPIDGPR